MTVVEPLHLVSVREGEVAHLYFGGRSVLVVVLQQTPLVHAVLPLVMVSLKNFTLLDSDDSLWVLPKSTNCATYQVPAVVVAGMLNVRVYGPYFAPLFSAPYVPSASDRSLPLKMVLLERIQRTLKLAFMSSLPTFVHALEVEMFEPAFTVVDEPLNLNVVDSRSGPAAVFTHDAWVALTVLQAEPVGHLAAFQGSQL